MFSFALTLTTPTGASRDFLVLFLAIIIGPPVVRRARIPGIIGLLLAGFVIGPHALDLVEQGNTTVPELGQLGLLYLMFVAGVELDLTMLRAHRRDALLYSAMTFTLPMAFGIVVGFALGWSTAATVLLGSLLASHTLLLYTSVRNAGLGADPAVPAAVGATVVTDTLTLVILAAVAGLSTGHGSAAGIALQIVLGLAVLLAFSFLLLPWLVRIAFRYLGTDRSVRYLLALAAFLGAATVAETFGIEGIVGAFFAGMAVNRLVPNEGPLMDRIEFFGSTVFIPIFILSVGLLLDPSVMVEGTTLKLAGLFVAACIGGKGLAAWLSRPVLGYSGVQAALAFSLSAPQAAATLAATIVGFNIGLFDDSVVNAVLVVILVSIVSGTVVLAWAQRRAGPGTPAPVRLGSRVLVTLESPAQAATALAIAARIAAPDGGVVRGRYARHVSEQHADAAAGLRTLASAGYAVGIDVAPEVLVHHSLVDGVLHEAVAQDASLVLIGQSQEGGGTSAVGGWGESVASVAPAPVVFLVGEAPAIRTVRFLRGSDRTRDSSPAAVLATTLVERLSAGRERRDETRSEQWAATLEAGDLAVVAYEPWDTFADPQTPPPGAAILLVPAPVLVPVGQNPGAGLE